ncbi:DNA repair protein RadC [Stappia sp. 22II-S9-Z10]|nr:DNA repair protein RadC [Stappia sp. 22II-S9-Z10]
MRDRFDRGEALPDYELLELLLFRSIPRRDTKPIAKALIAEFGSFAAVVSAPAARLLEVSGVGERVVGDFRLVRATAERLTHDTLKARAVLGSTDAVVEFYRAKLRGVAREEFHVLYLDKKNQMLASECAGTGTVDHTPVYPREVLKRALELSASAVVLIHNHPSGDPSPSRADIAVTAKIMEAAQPLGLSVHDHIIIGANAFTSLRGEGYV